MRRFILAGMLAVGAAAILAAPASAAPEGSFSVWAITKGGHNTGPNSFVFHGKLRSVGDDSEKVGHFAVDCRNRPAGPKCHFAFEFQNDGVNGDITAKGRLNNHHYRITGGDESFDDAQGEITRHGNGNRVVLTFHLDNDKAAAKRVP